jgi:hypothetical protein
MKPETPNRDDGRLSQLLHEYKVDASLPPRFNEQVWRRIESRAPAASTLANLRTWIALAFARPSFAISYVAILLLAGLLVGLWQAHATSQRTAETLSTRYVQMVDPYQTPHR